MASNVNTETLIKEIEIKPLLWDTNCGDYNNKHKKKMAWVDICSILIPDFKKESDTLKKFMIQDLISKWKIIRDTYVRYRKLKLKQLQTGAPAKKIREHTYVRELSFLNKIIDGNTGDSISDSQHSRDNNSDCEIIDTKSEPNIPLPVEFIPTGAAPEAHCARGDEPEIELELADTAECANPLSISSGAAKDEDLAFFYSLLPVVRSLTLDQKLAFRVHTLQLAQAMRGPPRMHVHPAAGCPAPPAIHLHLPADAAYHAR